MLACSQPLEESIDPVLELRLGYHAPVHHIGLDKEWKIVLHFHKRRLTEDQDMFVREGDFVLYGDSLYEITKLIEPRMLFGQIDYSFEITAECSLARETLFDAQ